MKLKIQHFSAVSVRLLLSAVVVATVAFAATLDESSRSQLRAVRSFQMGFDGYSGAVDSEIWALAPTTILENNPNASSDANNDGGESQVLIRFDGILGSDHHQVPKGAHIVSAKLYVSAFDQGNTVNLHRMLVPFTKTVTWSSMVDGASADGFEAARHKDSFTFGKIAANSSTVVFDVTDTVQFWSSGHPNHDWVFINTGGNGWDFYTGEFEDKKQRPRLVIEFNDTSRKPSTPNQPKEATDHVSTNR
ncbi:MAG: DNRLRE domain-containing protein [Pirellula sp.]